MSGMSRKPSVRPHTTSQLKPSGLPAQRWQGQLQGLHEGMLYGWAIDAEQPENRVVLEICLNGNPMRALVADCARQDLPEFGQFDVCHGFVADVSVLQSGGQGVLSVRVANTTHTLEGEVALEKKQQLAPQVLNFVFSDGGLRLYGWALDDQRPQHSPMVQAWLGNRMLAQTKANILHPVLRAYMVGKHGFNLDLPLSLADGELHQIRVLREDGQELTGSPIQICHHAPSFTDLEAARGQQPGLYLSLLQQYERQLPRSLGLQFYAQWQAHYDQSTQLPADFMPAPTPPAPAVLMLVYGEQDVARSVTSLQTQLGVTCHVIESGNNFASALQEAVQALPNQPWQALGVLRAGDTIQAAALAHLLHALALPDAELAYSDSELVLPDGGLRAWFKPAWNPEYALATDYPLELMLFKPALLSAYLQDGGALPDNPSALLWTMLARVWRRAERAIVHVPQVLYRFHQPLQAHELAQRWRAAQTCLAQFEAAASLQEAELARADHAPRRLLRPVPKAADVRVSLIIPTRDQSEMLLRCIDSLRQYTAWENLEILVADNDSCEKKTLHCFEKLKKSGIRIVSVPGAFNFSRINNLAVQAASGDVIGLINNDIEALHDGWLQEMLSHLMLPEVGAVGAKLLWPNGMVQHGGVWLGVGNVAGHFGNLLAQYDAGDHARNLVTSQVSAVTAACLLLRKADYLAVGGMDEAAFPVAFNDVDLCLKLRQRGQAVIWTPHACLLHAESASRGHEDTPQKKARAQREVENLRQRWGHVLLHDPAYHPALSLDAHGQAFSGLALPPRARVPRYAGLCSKKFG